MKNDIGYYKVGDKCFDSKYEAVLYAQKFGANITWHFFDEIFDNLNWYNEPLASLTELYKMRAQQIRIKYDYVIVFCSGGSDSTNVINSFLDNNIHVDEVIGITPMAGLNNWSFNTNNKNEDNTISETKLSLFPLLNEITQRSPSTKISLNDYFEDILKEKDDHWTYEACGNIVTVLTSQFTNVFKFKHIDKLIQQGKKVALVYGTDKPIIRINNSGELFFIFADAGINYLNMPKNRQYPNLDRVLFYWTPELPEMLIKQAHIVAKAIQLPENTLIKNSLIPTRTATEASGTFQEVVDKQIKQGIIPVHKDDILKRYMSPIGTMSSYLENFSDKTIYQREIVPFIYPNIKQGIFQCQKVDADQGFFTKDQNWIHVLHKNTRISELILSGTSQLYNSISPKFLNQNGTGFVNFFKIYKYSKLHSDKY